MEVLHLFISGSHHRRKRFSMRWSTVELRHRQYELPWRRHNAYSNLCWLFPNQSPIFGLISVWACHPPSPMQCYLTLIFLLHPLAKKNLFNIGLWQLKPMHFDSVLLSFFLHFHTRPHPRFCKGPHVYLFLSLFVLLIR